MSGRAQRIVILGAASGMAEMTARIWAAEGARFILVGRDLTRLQDIAADLKTRGADGATTWPLDCANADAASQLDQMVEAHFGGTVLPNRSQVFRVRERLRRLVTNYPAVVAIRRRWPCGGRLAPR